MKKNFPVLLTVAALALLAYWLNKRKPSPAASGGTLGNVANTTATATGGATASASGSGKGGGNSGE